MGGNKLCTSSVLMLPKAEQLTMLLPKMLASSSSSQNVSQGNNIEFMGHVVFTGSVVFVWGVEAQVGNLASIKAGKSLNLHYEHPRLRAIFQKLNTIYEKG